jgi:hypothetical protein
LSCVSAPTNLVGWWRGESNTFDQVAVNNGTLVGNAGYGVGEVGQAFVFDGNRSAVVLGTATNLQLQNFTIESWIKRASTSITSYGSYGNGVIFGFGFGGPGLYLDPTGQPELTKIGISAVGAGTTITDTNFHHLAVTKTGTTVVFYVDGVAYPAAAYDPGFVFSAPAAIGAKGDSGYDNSFLGTVDELSVYSRALSAAEVEGIYGAGSAGKCLTWVAPVITLQPATRIAHVGDTVNFSVAATGTMPLGYQWKFNDGDLAGQTGPSLTLGNVQATNSGKYTVLVSNPGGSVLSSNAFLTVNTVTACVPPPSGLVSWWKAEGNTLDPVGLNNGTLVGNAGYGPGEVGEGFVFDGNRSAVVVGAAANLQLQNFTIESWIKRASTSVTSFGSYGNGVIFGFGLAGYGLYLDPTGQPALTKIGISAVGAGTTITDTNFHHLAVTKTGTTVVFYVDGVAYPAPAYDPGFVFSAPAAIGAKGDSGYDNSFLGTVDELSVYSRALSAAEVEGIYGAGSAGKCPPPAVSNILSATKQNQPMSIPIAKMLLFASDPGGNPLALSGVSPLSTNGGAVVIGTNAVTYTPAAGFVGGDKFSWGVTNTLGGSASAYVLVTVYSANLPSGNLLPLIATPNGFLVTFAGIPGFTYTLQRAESVSGPWVTLTTLTADANGLGMFEDDNPPAGGAFYRTVYP